MIKKAQENTKKKKKNNRQSQDQNWKAQKNLTLATKINAAKLARWNLKRKKNKNYLHRTLYNLG